MTIVEEMLMLSNKNESSQESQDWINDINYKKKLAHLIHSLSKKDHTVMHLPDGNVDAFHFKMVKVRYTWSQKLAKFIRSPQANNRHYKNKDIMDLEE